MPADHNAALIAPQAHGVARAPSMRLLLAVSSLGAVLAPLNSTMIAVALPEIRHEFGLSHASAGWLISGYLIAMAVAQPLGGRLGDQLGHARVFRAGLLAFLAFSVGATIAPNFALLVAMRIAQAIAGAILIPNGMGMLRIMAPPEQLGRLNGINGAILSSAAAAGPLLGAGALALGSWRFVFPLSIPLVLAALVLVGRLEPADERRSTSTPIDWLGMALFVALLSAVTLQLSALRDGEDATTATIRWAALATIAFAFIWRQRATATPAAQWSLFRGASFTAATIWVLLTNLTMYTTLLMIPFFVRDVQGKSTQLAGLLLGAMSILVAIVSPFGGILSDRFGRRPLVLVGSVIALCGSSALLAVLRSDASPFAVAACLALLGLGLGISTGPAVTAAVESAPYHLAGSAAGTSSMMRYAGSIIGAGVLAGVLSDRSAGTADVTTFRLVAAGIVATAVLAVIVSTFIHRFASRTFTPITARDPVVTPQPELEPQSVT